MADIHLRLFYIDNAIDRLQNTVLKKMCTAFFSIVEDQILPERIYYPLTPVWQIIKIKYVK